MVKKYLSVGDFINKKYKTNSWLILLLALNYSSSVWANNLPKAEELSQRLGITEQNLANLNKGDIVYFDVAEGDEKELAVGVAMYLPAKPAKVMGVIKSKNLLSIDGEITSEGTIPTQATVEAFKGFGFKSVNEEAANFLAAQPGSEFNLSTEEFQTLHSIASGGSDSASQAYRNILLQRWQAYQKNGLKGIASYDRGNGTEASPGGELRFASQDSKFLSGYFPELYKAWLNYPVALPNGAEETFIWRNRQVEGRPTAILVHRIIYSAQTGELILSRQFYAGHSYNSNQLVIACLPYLDGSLVFYANRTFTDQVAGFGSGLKHSIGQKQAKSEITKLLKNLHSILKK
jgi:hypothetical protein